MRQPLGVWNFLQLRVEMYAAPARHLQLPLPILESRLLHRDRVLPLRNLNIRGRVANEAAVDCYISARWIDSSCSFADAEPVFTSELLAAATCGGALAGAAG